MITIFRFVCGVDILRFALRRLFTLKTIGSFRRECRYAQRGIEFARLFVAALHKEAVIRPNKRYQTGNDRIVRGWDEPHFFSNFGVRLSYA
jgi:hypothetical protein